LWLYELCRLTIPWVCSVDNVLRFVYILQNNNLPFALIISFTTIIFICACEWIIILLCLLLLLLRRFFTKINHRPYLNHNNYFCLWNYWITLNIYKKNYIETVILQFYFLAYYVAPVKEIKLEIELYLNFII
jgi:hypothetical protein